MPEWVIIVALAYLVLIKNLYENQIFNYETTIFVSITVQ